MYQNYTHSTTSHNHNLPYSDNHYGNDTGSHHLMSRIDEQSAFSLLQHLERDELQHLLDDDAKLQDLIKGLSQVKAIQEEHDNLIVYNKSLADYNLSLQPSLEELKQTVASAYQSQNALKTTLAEDKARLDSFVGQHSLDTLLALLQTETAKIEEESENLTSEFYDNQVEMEAFVNRFIPQRTTMHLRRIKSEKMTDMIREGNHMSSPPQPAPRSYPPPRENPPPLPYPRGEAFSMPLPRNRYQ